MNMLNVSAKRINLFKSHHSVVILTNEHVKCVKKGINLFKSHHNVVILQNEQVKCVEKNASIPWGTVVFLKIIKILI